ncbi:serine/threonine protein kinase [Aspergillus candidus]|uniref:Serine/threonine protein kinase n=1 Tax=Aspergillus candidus TaxID=41067 RepID=A0A2I2EZT5_ASPCN|nr:serine/threonine protein kinase [Aspergillus candidus]PLB33891.1 serine/threonine protein kinase [Aspergillus candidus]
MTSAYHVDPIGCFPQEQIFGMGRIGLVVRKGNLAVKLPLRWSSSSDDEMKANIECLQHEQPIYQRLGQCAGVVPCLGFTKTSIQLQLMENGDLRCYLGQNKASKSLQLRWFRTMARALARIHDRRILVVDIASRNFLLDSELSISFCGYTESTILPLSTCMQTVDGGYSIQTDIEQLGAVMYEVIVGDKCKFDIWESAPPDATRGVWPPREGLPRTNEIWLGSIIEKCWTQGAYLSAYDLYKELDFVELDDEPSPLMLGVEDTNNLC